MSLLLAATLLAPAWGADFGQPHDLANTGGWFLGGEVVGAIALGFLVPDLLTRPSEVPLTCDIAWCGTNGFDRTLNRALLASNPRLAGHISHGFTIGATPLVGLAGVIVPAALAGRPGVGAADTVIILNSFIVATGFNSIAKVRGRRQRPAFHYGRQGETEAAEHPNEEFLSFYSGDTTWAWSLAGSASTLAFLRGYDHAPVLAISLGTLAMTGSLLRMSGDMHWATDVLMGMATGTAVGVGLPLLVHHRLASERLSLTASPLPDGARVGVQGRW